MRAARILAVGLSLSLAILAVRWFRSGPPTEVRDRIEEESGSRRGGDIPRRLAPGTPVPNVALTDQEGQAFRLSDLRGNVVVLSFLYTNCNLPSVCPMTTSKLVRAQSLVLERRMRNAQFVLVSFDTERDDPEQLKAFARQYEPDFASFRFATGRPEDIATLSRALNIYYRPAPNGLFEHNSVVAFLDQQGRFRDWLVGTAWTVEDVVVSIGRVAGG